MNQQSYSSAVGGGSNKPKLDQILSLRDLQINGVIKMLNYNEPKTELKVKGSLLDPTLSNKKEDRTVWKVLVFDDYCQQVISLILRVNDLREQGVTLHLPLKSKRMAIGDVPAVYFVKPSSENVDLLIEDLKSNLYDSSFINFSSTLPRYLLENFANEAVKFNCTDKVSQIYDQYLSFMCLESNLFSLNLKNSYTILNSSNTPDLEIENTIEQITTGLLSVLATFGHIPIIKSTKGNAAEMIGRKLDGLLKDFSRSPTSSLSNSDTLFNSNNNTKNRPVLLIIDRNMDLIPMFSHSFTYQPLIHDLLNLKMNQVTIELQENDKTMTKTYDIDSKDFFWNKNAFLPFPHIADEIDVELIRYRKEAEELTRLSGTGDINQPLDFNNNTQQLKSAINALPELTVRKSIIDNHMNIATSLLNKIQQRHIDRFFELEESILVENKQTILDLIKDPECDKMDKFRLFLVYYLCHPNLNQSDLNLFKEALIEFDCDMKPFESLQRMHTVTKMSTLSAGSSKSRLTSTSNDFMDKFSSLSSQIRDGAYDKILNKVKHFLPNAKDLAITKLVQSILEPTSSNLEDLLHLDPKSRSAIARTSSPLTNPSNPPSTVIVFVVGGGTYLEHINLEQYLKRQTGAQSIIYGSTEILNSDQFIQQLAQI